MNPHSTTIQKKIMRVVMITSGAVLLMTTAAFFTYEVITFREITRSRLNTLSEIVAANSTAALAFDGKENGQEILNALKGEKHVVAACLYDKNGDIFSTYLSKNATDRFPAQLKKKGYFFTDNHLEIFQPVVQNNSQLGTLYIKSDHKAISSRLNLYGIIAAIFILISFLFAYFLSRRLQKTISGPILHLASTATTISDKGDYSVRASNRSNDELGLLTDAFNHMLTRIETQNAEITSLNLNLEHKIQNRTLELENANAVLKQQNEFVETIIDSSVDMIAVFDKDMRYLIVNKSACSFYNLSKEEFIGRHLLEVFPQVRTSAIMLDLTRALGGETVHNPNYRSAITNRYIENFYIPIKDENNKVVRVLLIGHDITSIMENNEKLLSLNSELEKSNRDLEQFAYVASHDLQEPLRKIQTFSELSEKNTHNPEILKRYLEKINSSAKRMTELIKAVLNYSRLAMEDKEFSAIDLNSIVEHIKTDLELIIAEKSAFIYATELPAVEGNPLQIHQLFLNLISNSLKFSEQSPEIRISGKIVAGKEVKNEIGIRSKDDYIELTFQDNGIGFEQQYAHKIFSIFQRLHSGKNYTGTGIGLALCKKIVENHNGSITVNSAPGKGTIFYIYLPVRYKQNGKDDILRKEKNDSSIAGN